MSKASIPDGGLDLGLVVAGYGRHYIVETPEGRRVICHPRGKKSECVVGDRLRWQPAGDEGVIEHIEPRRNLLFRQDEWKTKAFAANLDQIMVMEQGQIVERGTHAQLYAARGRYYDLYTRQHGVEENLFLAPGEGDAVGVNGNGADAKNADVKAGDALRVLRGEMR